MNQQPVIILDWDGTIADSMDLCVEEVRVTMAEMNLPIPSAELMRQCNGPTFEETVELLDIPRHRAQEYLDIRQAAGLRLCPAINRLYPGMKELLQSLQGKARLCIASNGTPEYIEECHRCFGTGELFTMTCASKPGRSKTQAVAEILNALKPEKAVMIGDRLGDINAGKGNALMTICVSYGYGSQEEWNAADHIAHSMDELKSMLEGFTQEA